MESLLNASAKLARATITHLRNPSSERRVCSAAVARGVHHAVRENAQLLVSR